VRKHVRRPAGNSRRLKRQAPKLSQPLVFNAPTEGAITVTENKTDHFTIHFAILTQMFGHLETVHAREGQTDRCV